MHRECFECDISQMKKISAFMQLGREKEGQLIKLAGDYLKTCDMSKSNPEIMGEIWGLIIDVVGTDNPYKEIKSYYNQLVLSMSDMIRGLIDQSGRRLECGLKLAIAGNLIDFAARHRFDENTFKELIQDIAETEIAVNHSNQLFQAVKSSRTLLYLGDNCGEIVLDKYFISLLKEYNKELYVYYGVRGKPIVNDVTADDASEAGMQEAAEVISNGDGSLGTVLHRGLQDCGKENLFFLFMAKCGIVADPLGVKKMSVVCMKKERHRRKVRI